MEANANKAWDGWCDVWHLMKLALQHQWRCGNFIIQWGWIWWDVLRPMTTSMSLGHCWIQCRGNHKAWGIKIKKVCHINVLFSCFKFSSWCLVCISNVQLMMMFGVHFKRSTHDVGYAFQNTFPFICHDHTCLIGTYFDFIWCVLFACVELTWVFCNAYNFWFCVVLSLRMACDANQQCIFPSLSGASPCLDDKHLSEAWTCTWIQIFSY